MRILCDHHVAPKYIQAFEEAGRITVTTVEEVLTKDASDATIGSFAVSNDWVVFTNDSDFYRLGADHGLLVYSQLENPSPKAVVEAIRRIEEGYVSENEINEVVPGKWVE